jgi:AraC-like DNA-binding protein
MNVTVKSPSDGYSDWNDGPSLIAIRGDDLPGNEYRLGTREYDWHHHLRGQVFCVEAGLIHVTTANGAWLLPPHRAGWMPPNVPHKVRVSGALSGWTLFLAPQMCNDFQEQPCVIGISEVLRALASRAVEWNKDVLLSPEQERIAAVIRDEIRQARHEALHLPMPSDSRLKKIAYALLEAPGTTRTLEDWASLAAMSPRTLRRLIVAETGLTFAQWRQQAQLTHGLDMLARGISVAEVSDELGYASPSNFIAMFKRAFGASPARYFGRTPHRSPATRLGRGR